MASLRQSASDVSFSLKIRRDGQYLENSDGANSLEDFVMACNIIEGIEFHKLDCCDLKKVQQVMKGVDVVYHCAATAHEGLSVFSPYEITKNNYLASVSIFTAAINNKVKSE